MTLEIEAEWITWHPWPDDPRLRADRAAYAAIRIGTRDHSLTRAWGPTGDDRDAFQASGYQLALWLCRNWWRLAFEAERADYRNDAAWLDGHSVASIGESSQWPPITIAADGESVVLRATPTPMDVEEPVTWLSHGRIRVPRALFLDCAERFMAKVLVLLKEAGVRGTELHRSQERLWEERLHPQTSSDRGLEASLGYGPGLLPREAIERVLSTHRILGAAPMGEVAAGQSAGQLPPSADRLREIAARRGFSTGLGGGAVPFSLEDDLAAEEPAWKHGEEAARAVRRRLMDSNEPVSSLHLTDLCSTPPESLTDEDRFDPMAFSLREEGRDGRVVLRSRWETERRFEMARLLGDQLLFPAEEPLRPATGSGTFRQRIQRTFAAEFLCPYEALLDFLKEDFSETALAEAGRHFVVPPRVVKTILVNRHHLPRKALPDRDF